jgi:tetratricopeptide (TPR) repeat protein
MAFSTFKFPTRSAVDDAKEVTTTLIGSNAKSVDDFIQGSVSAHYGHSHCGGDSMSATEFNLKQALIYYNSGMADYANGKYDSAVKHFSATIELNSKGIKAYDNAGDALYCMGQPEIANQYYIKANELAAKSFPVYRERGQAFYAMSQHMNAAQDFKVENTYEPRHAMSFFTKGVGLYKSYIRYPNFSLSLRDRDNAIPMFNIAIILNSRLGDAFFYRGHLLLCKKERDLAIQDLSKAIELGCKLNDAHRYLKKALTVELSKPSEAIFKLILTQKYWSIFKEIAGVTIDKEALLTSIKNLVPALKLNVLAQALVKETFLGQLFYTRRHLFYTEPNVTIGTLKQIAGALERELATSDAKVMLSDVTKTALCKDTTLQEELKKAFPSLYQKLKPIFDAYQIQFGVTNAPDIIIAPPVISAVSIAPSAPSVAALFSNNKSVVEKSDTHSQPRINSTIAQQVDQEQIEGALSVSVNSTAPDSEQQEGQTSIDLSMDSSASELPDQSKMENNFEKGLLAKLALLPAPPTYRITVVDHKMESKNKIVARVM